MRRRAIVLISTLAVVAVGVTLTVVPQRTSSTTTTVAAVAATPTQQQAALSATLAYRNLIGTATQRFASAVRQLEIDATRGDIASSRDDYFRAQTAYDIFRSHVSAGSTTAISLDGRIKDFPKWLPVTGLHAIERDLFGGHHESLVSDATWLTGQAIIVEFSLTRLTQTPSQMVTRTSQNLAWAIDEAISRSSEIYCQHSLADVVAVTRAAGQVLQALTPLGSHVDAAATAVAAQRFHELTSVLNDLGEPAITTDASITRAQWRRASVAIDAFNSALSNLGGSLWGFGTGRTYA